MARWSGKVGFITQAETMEGTTPTGIWEETIVEKTYTGDQYNTKRIVKDINGINDRLSLSNQISFIADPYALQNYVMIRYATFMGQKWKVNDILIESPRLVITLGDVYNG